jgi:outer membrane protein assembly factor BamB
MKNRRIRQVVYIFLLAGFLLGAIVLAFLSSQQALRNLITSPSEQFQQEGDAYKKDGRLPEAVLSYRQAVEFDAKNEKALEALVKAYSEQGRMRMAARFQMQLAKIQGVTPEANNSFFQEHANPLKLIWSNLIRESTPVGAALEGNRLLIGYEDGTVAAASIEDGKILWTAHLPSSVTSLPVVSHREVWVGTSDGNLFALSILDGQIDWVYMTDGPIYAAPAVIDEVVFCPSSDGSLYAIQARTGTLLWKFSTQGSLHSSPTVDGDRIFFGSTDGKLYAVDRTNGAPIWRDGILTSGSVESQPIVADGRVIFGSGDGRVYALSTETGGQFWRYSTADAVFSRVLLDKESIYITSSGGSLSAVSYLTGQKFWKTDFESALRNAPVLINDQLYLIAEADPNLYIINKNNGAVIDKIFTGDWLTGGPLTTAEKIVLLGKDGMVFALSIPR